MESVLKGGGWKPVLGRKYSRNEGRRRSHDRVITIFAEDLPKGMDNGALRKLFARYGVVLDAFVPRKLSKAGKRFGFVRFDCELAAEVAIQKTNGLLIQDKELRVKLAAFEKNQHNSNTPKEGKVKVGKREIPKRGEIHNSRTTGDCEENQDKRSYSMVVKGAKAGHGGMKERRVKVIHGDVGGKEWLARSFIVERASCRREVACGRSGGEFRVQYQDGKDRNVQVDYGVQICGGILTGKKQRESVAYCINTFMEIGTAWGEGIVEEVFRRMEEEGDKGKSEVGVVAAGKGRWSKPGKYVPDREVGEDDDVASANSFELAGVTGKWNWVVKRKDFTEKESIARVSAVSHEKGGTDGRLRSEGKSVDRGCEGNDKNTHAQGSEERVAEMEDSTVKETQFSSIGKRILMLTDHCIDNAESLERGKSLFEKEGNVCTDGGPEPGFKEIRLVVDLGLDPNRGLQPIDDGDFNYVDIGPNPRKVSVGFNAQGVHLIDDSRKESRIREEVLDPEPKLIPEPPPHLICCQRPYSDCRELKSIDLPIRGELEMDHAGGSTLFSLGQRIRKVNQRSNGAHGLTEGDTCSSGEPDLTGRL
ncbi:hypothetical protein Dimus_003271 [Dionaea muscipula]